MARKIQADDLFAFELAGDAQISPCGGKIAYVSQRLNREENRAETSIYVQERGGEPQLFTAGPRDSHPRFHPDGETLAFLRPKDGVAQIWLLPLSGGEARPFTDVPGRVSEFTWSPDGRRLAFICELGPGGLAGTGAATQVVPSDSARDELFAKYTAGVHVVDELLHKMDGVGYYDEKRPCLCVVSLDDPTNVVQLTTPPYLVSNPIWSPDGETLFIKGNLGENYDRVGSELQIWALPSAGGAPWQVTPVGLSSRTADVSPDGKTLAVMANQTDEMSYDNAAVYLVPVTGGEARRLAANWDTPLDNKSVLDMVGPGGGAVTWSPDGKSLFCFVSDRGMVHVGRIDVEADAVHVLTKGDRVVTSYSVSPDAKTVAMTVAEPAGPSNVFYLDVETGAEEQVTRLNEALLAELELSLPERFQSRSEGGPAVDGWMIRPHDMEEGKKYPTVLSIHGGPALMYTSAFFFEFQLLAAQGYGIVYANPRGSHGYGEEFCKAIQWEWGGADYDDLMATVDEALARYEWVDKDRLGVMGGSYGGFMTNWIVGHTDRFAAAVTGRSIADYRSQCGTGDLGPFRFKRVNNIPYWVDSTWYDQQSPITYVENVTTPILIEHQEHDYRCPLEQAQMWYSAIKYLDKAPVRLVIYPGESHGMSRTGKPWHRIHRLEEIGNWFAQYLRPEA